MRATFHPQAWVNDYAIDVDPQGDTSWDLTPAYVEQLQRSMTHPEEVLEANTYESDELRQDPAAPKWVRDWCGPFYVEVSR